MGKRDFLQRAISSYGYTLQGNGDKFDNKIIYISAGAIGLLIVKYDQHSERTYDEYLILASLFTLLCSCVLNVFSYHWFNNKISKEKQCWIYMEELLDEDASDADKEVVIDLLINRCSMDREMIQCFINASNIQFRNLLNKRLDALSRKGVCFNGWNLIVMILGLILSVLYFIL